MKSGRVLLVSLALAWASPASADDVPAEVCVGRDCAEENARPAETCKGPDCARLSEEGVTDCTGQDCDAIPQEPAPAPEIETVEPQREAPAAAEQ